MDEKNYRGVMLLVSVLFHGVLALLPWQEKPRPLAVSSAPARPIPIIDASQLPTLPAPESQPAPTVVPFSPPPVPVVPPAPPVAPPADPPAVAWLPEGPISEMSDSPIDELAGELADELAPEAALDADWTPEAPIPETRDTPDIPEATDIPEVSMNEPISEGAPDADSTAVAPVDEAKIAADWAHLVGHFQDQEDGFASFPLLDIFNLFGEPEQVTQFFDENNQPKLDISSFYLFPEQTPEQVLQTVVMPELTHNTGFDLQPQEDFTAGLAYQLLQGEVPRYLIIVRLNERSGSVLLLSHSLSGLESQKPQT